MPTQTLREALRDAMAEEMRRDPEVFVMGEEVAEYQGAYKVTQGLLQEFGDSSPSLQVLRNVGLCLETEGNLQRRLALARGASISDRRSAEEAARAYYQSSEEIWDEWVRRGAETPESKRESMRVRRLTDELRSGKIRRL